MEKVILEALKAKFPEADETTLGRIAKNLAKTAKTEDEATAAVEGVTFRYIIDSESDYRVAKAKSKWEKGLHDNQPAPAEGAQGQPAATASTGTQGGAPQRDDTEVPAWMQGVIDSVASIRKELAEIRGEKTSATRKSRLAELLKDAPEPIRNRYEKDFARMNFTDDEDFDGWMDDIAPDVEKIVSDYSAKQGVVSRPKSGGKASPDSQVNPYLKERIAEHEAETVAPAIQGLPSVAK